jgi:5,10-methylenetetrahydrofolate reductase
MSLTLAEKLSKRDLGVYLIGTTPPKEGTDDETMRGIARKLLARLSNSEYDGMIVYDIQDESARISTPRPFPFSRTRDPREYAKILGELNGLGTVTYNSVAQGSKAEFRSWLDETVHEFDQSNLVLVGSPAANTAKMSLPEAYETTQTSATAIQLGGVSIAERHVKKGDEHLRLIEKQRQGCSYFISQAVYNPQATIDMLTAYARECREQDIEPARIILTFTPCGSAKTLEFMRWLGISIPEATGYRILDAENPLLESQRICYANLRQILAAVIPLGLPLGLNIESLTNRKEEIDAAIALYRLLKARMELSMAQAQIGI